MPSSKGRRPAWLPRWASTNRLQYAPFSSKADYLLHARALELVAMGIVARTTYVGAGPDRKRWPLYGKNGTLIGHYAYDERVECVGGLVVAVDSKGLESRDFPLRRDLYRDNYCVRPGGAGQFVDHRLDVVPVLSREDARDFDVDVFHYITSWHPHEWPDVEADLRAKYAARTAARSRLTKAAKAANAASLGGIILAGDPLAPVTVTPAGRNHDHIQTTLTPP